MNKLLSAAIVALVVAIPLFVIFSIAGIGTLAATVFAALAGAVASAGKQLFWHGSKTPAQLGPGLEVRTIDDVGRRWQQIDQAIGAYPNSPAHEPLRASVANCLTSIRKNSALPEITISNDYRLSTLDRILSNFLQPSVELYGKVAHNAQAQTAFNEQLTVLTEQVNEITEELDQDALSRVLAQSEVLSNAFNDNLLDLPRS